MVRSLLVVVMAFSVSCTETYHSYTSVPDDFVGTFYEISENVRMGLKTADTLIIQKNSISFTYGRSIDFLPDSLDIKALHDSLTNVLDDAMTSFNLKGVPIVKVNMRESSLDDIILLCDTDPKKTKNFHYVYEAAWREGLLSFFSTGPDGQNGDPEMILIGKFARK
jgi:hypothetical protein